MIRSFWALFYEKAWFYIKQYDQIYSFILYLLIMGILTPAILALTKYNLMILLFFWIISVLLWFLFTSMGVKIFRR